MKTLKLSNLLLIFMCKTGKFTELSCFEKLSNSFGKIYEVSTFLKLVLKNFRPESHELSNQV